MNVKKITKFDIKLTTNIVNFEYLNQQTKIFIFAEIYLYLVQALQPG